MAIQAITTRLTPEGWSTIPSVARAALGAGAGDRVTWLVEGDQVRVVSAARLLEQFRATLPAGADEGDSSSEVRAMRRRDQAVDAVMADAHDDERTDDEVVTGLVTALGLPE